MAQSRSQSGYITVLTAFFLVALALALITLFDSGQLLSEKTRLQHVADSAAYSAAVMQARELNFHASMNRAMVANQVAIGQMVSLSSFLQSNQQLWWELARFGQVLQMIPYVGQILKAATQMAEVTMGSINFAAQYAGSNFVQLSDLAIGYYSAASQLWHRAAIAETALGLRELVTLNDPRVDIALGTAFITGMDLRDWYGFIRQHQVSRAENPGGSKAQRHHVRRLDEFRDVVLDSRDGFMTQRDGTFWDLNYGWGKIEMRQRGGSHFGGLAGKKRPYYSWSAVDTMSLWHKSFGYKKSWEETIPMAWGRQATVHRPRAFSWSAALPTAGWRGATENGAAYQQAHLRDLAGQGYLEGLRGEIKHIGHFKVADNGANQGFGQISPQSNRGNVKGLRNFYDLREDNRLNGSDDPETVDAATRIHIFLSKSLGSTRTSQTMAGMPRDGGPLDLMGGRQATASTGTLHAMAAGRAIFEKPWRHQVDQRRIELANLYSPYWQPRLVDNQKRNEGRTAAFAQGVVQ